MHASFIRKASCPALAGALLVLGFIVYAEISFAKTESLPAFNVELKETSVSGLSSGAYMAVQFELAHSAIIKGAGIIAGGPYFCAQNDITRATTICSCTALIAKCKVSPGGTDVSALAQKTRDEAGHGRIDPLSHVSNHRIFLFSGTKDILIPQTVMDDLDAYYRIFVKAENIKYKKDIAAHHAVPTDSFGKACDHLGGSFINNCGYDAAGELLKQIYGSLKPRNTGKLSGSLMEFDQGEFIEKPGSHGMDDSGWAYVPASCKEGKKCRVHVAFHGCKQGHKDAGMDFIEHAGYNEWADTNNIIILYPQVIPKKIFDFPGAVLADKNNTNPQGCWNWWGYDKDTDYAVKSGRQITAVKGMLDRLAGMPGGKK
jgi:poly(3-hydroxybutyrate) depolymerase